MDVLGRGCIGLLGRHCGVHAVFLLIRTLPSMTPLIKALFDNPSENFNFACKPFYFLPELVDFICFLRER